MPAPLDQDAVSYLKQQGLPVTTTSLNRTMGLLQQQPNLRPSYAGQGSMDVDIETMKPVYNTKIEGQPLPPLQSQGNTNSSFGQAFKAARAKLGAGQTFDWNGKKYTTDYKEEVAKKPGQGPAKVTSGDGTHDKFNGDEPEAVDNINEEAEEDIQQGLAEEKANFAAMDEKKRNTKRVSAGRGGYVDMPMDDTEIANRDMDEMLGALIGVGGLGAAAGATALTRPKNPVKGPQSMQEGDLYGKPSAPSDAMTEEDLYGKKPQQMTDADLGYQEKQLNAMTDADLYGKQETDAEFLDRVLKDAEFVGEEQQAAKMLKAGNKQGAKRMLGRLKNLGADKRLINILKAL